MKVYAVIGYSLHFTPPDNVLDSVVYFEYQDALNALIEAKKNETFDYYEIINYEVK